MKIIGTILIVLGVIALGGLFADSVYSNYQYSNGYSSYWDLSDKASSIAQKSVYLDKFVSALQGSGLQGCSDSLYFPTPTNSFDQNFIALLSLQGRMHDIVGMDPNSFQYQSAMEQITGQEQGQASDMLTVFEDCWMKVHHYWLWNDWLSGVWLLGPIILIFAGILFWAA